MCTANCTCIGSRSLETDGWHINYELKDSQLNGGGPHYIIDATTGAIVSKTYTSNRFCPHHDTGDEES